MLIDGFTVIAQIINFLILVFLLKKFLYGPITKAMAKRQAEVQQRLDEAAEERAIAQQEKALYQDKQQALDQHRDDLLAQVRTEVEAYKQQLLTQAETEVDTLRQRWQRGLAQDQQMLAQSLQHRISQTLTQSLREVLADLTDTTLEDQLARVFQSRLQQLSPDDRQQLQTAMASQPEQPVTIVTTFPLSPEQSQRLTQQFQQQFDTPIPLQFEQIDNGALSIELRIGGYRLTWGMTPYLAKLQADLAKAINRGEGVGNGG